MEQQTDLWGSQSGSLEQRHQQLLRVSKAMWILLKSRLGVSDADLQALLSEASPVQSQLIECSVCRNPLQSTARCCLYCGTSPHEEVKSAELQGRLSRSRLTQQ